MTGAQDPPADDARLAFALAALLFAGETVSRLAAPTGDAVPAAFERHRVDVNAAPRGEIEALPGVGRVLADRVVAERAKRPFASVDDLRRVAGMGAATIERLRAFARCGGAR